MGEHMFVMPWKPRYTEAEARVAIGEAASWMDVLAKLGCEYHGKNIATVRKWAARWQISTRHLSDQRGPRPRYTEPELRNAIAASRSWAETLRRLGYCPTGGNCKTLKRRAAEAGISYAHFDPYARSREQAGGGRIPLAEVLVEHSIYDRSSLKPRLYAEGVKQAVCELCGQGEMWRGKRMGLILDHVNGTRDDNRLENLRIVCPNCAATLDTHCGRKTRTPTDARKCRRCDEQFQPNRATQRYCSRYCGSRWDRAADDRSRAPSATAGSAPWP